MRRQLVPAVLSFAVVACAPSPAPGPAGDGELVLELGGALPSLRGALLAAGQEVDAPRRLEPPAAVDPLRDGGADRDKPDSDASPLDPTAGPTPQPKDDERLDETPDGEVGYQLVELRPGETLTHLAQRYLGDGRRYVEIMRLNGFDEAEARRLRAHSKVRVPLASPPVRDR